MSNTTKSPVHVQAMSAPYSRPLRYSVFTRFYDSRWIGRRDADQQLAHTPAAGEQPSASLRALSAKHRERCERERMGAVLIAAPLIDRRTTLFRKRDALQMQIDEWNTQIDEWNTQIDEQGTATADELASVRKTEAHMDTSQRAARRQREASTRVAPLVSMRAAAQRELVGMRRELAGIPLELADIDGRLTTLFESLQARVATLTFHYERRSQAVARGYLRRTPADAEHPLNTRSALRVPDWASAPNPWLDVTATGKEVEQ